MLSDKPWKPEAVLRLAASVSFCLAVGMAVTLSLEHWLPGLGKSQKDFISFVAGGVCFQGAAMVFVHFFLREHGLTWREGFGLSEGKFSRMLALAGLAIVVVLPVALALGKLSELVMLRTGRTPQLQIAVQMLQTKLPLGQILVYALAAVVLAPVAEEVLFRGVLYPTLKQSGHRWLALWVTSLLFASIHFNLMAFVPLTFLALVLAWLYERTGNLLASILAHVLFNAVNFTLLMFAPSLVKGH